MTRRIVKAVRQNLVAWLALFVALGGTSLATSRYVVNSTKQISPKVLKKLKGKPGPRGATGATGSFGAAGTRGEPGPRGEVGPQGPGATTFTATLAEAANGIIANANGVHVKGACGAGDVVIELDAPTGSTLELSGTASKPETGIFAANADGTTATQIVSASEVDWDVIVRDGAVGKFERLDAYGKQGSPCKFWGMITPSS
jgi:hypothetical protein